MKRILWLLFALLAPAALAAAPTPAELGAQAMAFLQHGRDIHVVNTDWFLDGGSQSATLVDAGGATATIMILNKRRAQQTGAVFGVYEEKHHREYFPAGDAQAAFKSALVAALRRSQVSNPDTRRLLHALTSWFPTYGEDIHWSASRAGAAEDALGRVISPARAVILGGAIVLLVLVLGFSILRHKRQERTLPSA